MIRAHRPIHATPVMWMAPVAAAPVRGLALVLVPALARVQALVPAVAPAAQVQVPAVPVPVAPAVRALALAADKPLRCDEGRACPGLLFVWIPNETISLY